MSDVQKYFLEPGYIFVSKEPYMVPTVLGSCVAVCLWDKVKKYGGINHFIYSNNFWEKTSSSKYGNVSIPHLIRTMKKMGSRIENLQAHVIGGAENPVLGSYIGRKNVSMAKRVLKKYHIPIVSEDTGGTMGRKLIFNNKSGETVVLKTNNLPRDNWYI